ncbi:MAG: hypothetical protein ACFFAO_15900 [Candidatus Hermodarchaeota archaeon]
MTDTTRTTVTLTEYYMERIDRLVGKFATTKAQVISKIVELFLDSKNYFSLIERLEQEKEAEEKRKAKDLAKKPEIYEQKIRNVLSGGNKIPIEEFLNYLNIDTTFFFDHLPKWKEEFNFTYEDNKIIRK